MKKEKIVSPQGIKSIIFGFVYALLLCGLTCFMDMAPVPEKESGLWIIMLFFYAVIIIISVFLEKLIKEAGGNRTLFYLVAQAAIFIVILILSIVGIQEAEEEYYNSRELSFAMAFVFLELVLLLYHLVRSIVFRILRTTKENSPARKNTKKKSRR